MLGKKVRQLVYLASVGGATSKQAKASCLFTPVHAFAMLSTLQLLIASAGCTMMSVIGRNHILKRYAGVKWEAILQLLSLGNVEAKKRVCRPPEGQAGCRVWMLIKDGIVQYGLITAKV
eukprot:scaffold18984_cov211-Skeletonema_marinoi.AAC.1